MPRSRITKAGSARARSHEDGSAPTPRPRPESAPTPLLGESSAPTPPLVVDDQFDAALGVYALFVLVPKSEVVYFRLVVESWEDFAVVRTMSAFSTVDRLQQMVVVMAVPDYLEPCARGLRRLCAEVDGRQVLATPEMLEALRRDLLGTETPGL